MPGPSSRSLNPLAEAANQAILKDCPVILDLLSERGKVFFFPAGGIPAQGAEARQKAKFANATTGIALENGEPMFLECVNKHFSGLSPREIYDYVPSYGLLELRRAWAEKQREDTPSLGRHPVSTPLVTNALTHGLSVVGELFLDPGDEVLCSDLHWENYEMVWETRLGARISYFPFFDEGLRGFNLPAFGARPEAAVGAEAGGLPELPEQPLRLHAHQGRGPGHRPDAHRGRRSRNPAGGDLRRRLLRDVLRPGLRTGVPVRAAGPGPSQPPGGQGRRRHQGGVRLGLRVGFITYGVANGTPGSTRPWRTRRRGMIRSVVSSVTHPGQTIILKALRIPDFRRQQAEKVAILRARAEATGRECRKPEYQPFWDVYPYNSGYFMCLRLKRADAETVRTRLLDDHGVGTIALGQANLRVAFSCLTEAQIPGVFSAIATVVARVASRP